MPGEEYPTFLKDGAPARLSDSDLLKAVAGGIGEGVIEAQNVKGYEQLSSEDLVSSAGLPNIPEGAVWATVRNSGGSAVRWLVGSDPTATYGTQIPASESENFYGADMAAARFIDTGANAVLDVTYRG